VCVCITVSSSFCTCKKNKEGIKKTLRIIFTSAADNILGLAKTVDTGGSLVAIWLKALTRARALFLCTLALIVPLGPGGTRKVYVFVDASSVVGVVEVDPEATAIHITVAFKSTQGRFCLERLNGKYCSSWCLPFGGSSG